MEDKKRIKDIYKCDYINSDDELYPLQRWYNNLIDKTINEITVADVLRMMRQKEFLNLAMEKAMDFLQDDVLIGETYDGELLERVSEINQSFLSSYSDNLGSVLKEALDIGEMYEWSYDGEREEFNRMVNSLLKKIL